MLPFAIDFFRCGFSSYVSNTFFVLGNLLVFPLIARSYPLLTHIPSTVLSLSRSRWCFFYLFE